MHILLFSFVALLAAPSTAYTLSYLDAKLTSVSERDAATSLLLDSGDLDEGRIQKSRFSQAHDKLSLLVTSIDAKCQDFRSEKHVSSYISGTYAHMRYGKNIRGVSPLAPYETIVFFAEAVDHSYGMAPLATCRASIEAIVQQMCEHGCL